LSNPQPSSTDSQSTTFLATPRETPAMSFPCRVLFAITLALLVTRAQADNLTTTSGKQISGELVAVDAQGVTLSTNQNSQVKVPAKEIHLVDLGHHISPPPKDAKYQELELTDGSTFRIAKFAIKGKKVVTELLPGPQGLSLPTYEITLGAVFSIMRSAENPKNHDAWKKMLANRGKRDLYVIREAEGLNFVSGTILSGNEAGEILSFEKEDGAKAELRLSRATGGLVFAQPQPNQIAPTMCKVFDVFGNALIAQSVDISSAGVTVTTVNGIIVKYSNPNAISKLDYSQGNVAYLSDLEPQVEMPEIGVDEKGLRLNVTAPFIKDRCFSNEPLKFGSEIFPKGISIASDAKLTFNIGGDYRELKALVGLQETSPDANLEARLTIETEDGRVLFSEILKRKDKPKSVVLDVKGVKQIRIMVEADFPVNGNWVILAEARVQK
jgi:hypothetical protein